MTLPRDEDPGSEASTGQSDSESQTDALTVSPADEHAPASQGDLWASDASEERAAKAGLDSTGRQDEGNPFVSSDGTEAVGIAVATAGIAVSGGGARRRWQRVAWELTQTLVLAVLIFLLVRTVAQNFRVEGPSMEPGLHNGQYLLVNKAVYFDLGDLAKFIPFVHAGSETQFLFHGPQRGDVIVFRYPRDPDRDFIKRIIGVPGDRVRVEEGIVYVNDVQLEEDYITDHAGRDLEEQAVPPGNYFVLGDNRPNSSDSRSWGFVPEENIIGKAILSYWPLDDLGGVGNRSLDLGLITLPLP